MMSTSGTTGAPKGVPVPMKALIAFRIYMADAVDLRPDDRFWNIADPGWAYGLYYAVTGPLLLGHATTFYDGPFTAESTYGIIERRGINNLAGSPTAFRLLIAAGPEPARRVKGQSARGQRPASRSIPRSSAGSPSISAAPIHDHYGQTELGMLVNNHHGLEHEFASARRLAMPGYAWSCSTTRARSSGRTVPGDAGSRH